MNQTYQLPNDFVLVPLDEGESEILTHFLSDKVPQNFLSFTVLKDYLVMEKSRVLLWKELFNSEFQSSDLDPIKEKLKTKLKELNL